MSVENLLSKLERVKRTGPDRWIACCPAHGDLHPSLSIRELPDGRVLLHDFGGCDVGDICAAIGLDLSDLYPARLETDEGRAARERQAFSAADALRCLSTEGSLLAVCAQALARGNTLDEKTRHALLILLIAVGRINNAIEVCHG
jgi:hypothetical protein